MRRSPGRSRLVAAQLIADREALAPFGAAAGKDVATMTVGHSFAEAVLVAALPVGWFVSKAHGTLLVVNSFAGEYSISATDF